MPLWEHAESYCSSVRVGTGSDLRGRCQGLSTIIDPELLPTEFRCFLLALELGENKSAKLSTWRRPHWSECGGGRRRGGVQLQLESFVGGATKPEC
jgi:hypothetical protein